MIFVKRPDPPPDLDGEDSPGGEELARWRAYFEAKAEGIETKKPTFSAYGRDQVRTTLKDAFHGKCAYCESEVLSIGHGDIEHWRPKGAVKGSAAEGGYWWLAAKWENLLLSCALCNQPPGKGTQFPLAEGSPRAAAEGDEELEQPLLIDPTSEDPDEFLGSVVVTEDDEELLLIQAIDEPGDEPRGQTTIEVFRLNRPELAGERAKLVLRLEALKADVRAFLVNLNALPAGPAKDRNAERVAAKLEELHELMDDAAEFTSVARFIGEPFLEEIGARQDAGGGN